MSASKVISLLPLYGGVTLLVLAAAGVAASFLMGGDSSGASVQEESEGIGTPDRPISPTANGDQEPDPELSAAELEARAAGKGN